MLLNDAMRRVLADAEGGSDMVKAAWWSAFERAPSSWRDESSSIPSIITTSCIAELFSTGAKRGAGLLPYREMYSTAASVSIVFGMSRRSLP